MKARRNTPARPKTQRGRFRQGPRTRAGLLTAPHMDFGEIDNAEWLMFEEGATLAPIACEPAKNGTPQGAVNVISTAGVSDIESHALAGVVVPGAVDARSVEAESRFDKLVNTACNKGVPVMAFGPGVARTLQAVGYEAPANAPPALLLHKGVRILETAADVRDALSVFHGVQARRAA